MTSFLDIALAMVLAFVLIRFWPIVLDLAIGVFLWCLVVGIIALALYAVWHGVLYFKGA